MKKPFIKIELPSWIDSFVDWKHQFSSVEEKMNLAINLAEENVVQSTGGPFGAAIFNAETGRVLSVGMNQVVRQNNSCLHAEIVAIMAAQNQLQAYSLNAPELPSYELFSSCEPCCMCLGAVLWSGVRSVVCAATKEDASRVGFDEGPVYESSYEYLTNKGIEVKRQILREAGAKIFDLYKKRGGIIYNR